VILFRLEVAHQHFRGTYCLSLEGQRIRDTAQCRTKQTRMEQNRTEAPQLLKCEEISASYNNSASHKKVTFINAVYFDNFFKETSCYYLKVWIWRQRVLVF
jgi:hypothetical protein